MVIAPQLRTKVIEGVLDRLNESYVFPDVAKQMAAAIHERIARKEYDEVTSAKKLAALLTAHLQAISHDKHLQVNYAAKGLPRPRKAMTPEDIARFRQRAAARNFGFERVERLPGNIGYLDLRGFLPASEAGETAAAAMNFLTHTDALILDLRQNGGGDPSMVALLSSYLFPAEPVVQLSALYFRPDNSTHQWWTLPYVPGKRYLDKPVYVLTSRQTFSAGEACAYDLKSLKRATIIGECTGGGAHPGGPQPIVDKFFVWVPSGRAINPITKTNWEGVGVRPDIETPAKLALKTAQVEALRKVRDSKKTDADAARQLGEALDAVQKELDDLKSKGGNPPPAGK
jgi:C-terminal processing protease CtpA/Prc